MVRSLLAVLAVGFVSVAAQSPVTSAIFDKLIHYTSYAAVAYSEDCPTVPFGSSILQTLNYSTIDNKAMLFHEPSSNEVILAFRGSAFPANLDQDFYFAFQNLNIPNTNCPTCQVHAGFQDVYNAMSASITAAVQSALAKYPGAQLVVTGHSLGAGLASLSATSLAAGGYKPIVYTYGEPRNGNAAFTSYANKLLPTYYRVTHYNDGVPQIPPVVLGYEHHGTEYWQSKSTANTAATTYECPGIDPSNCVASLDYGTNPINGAHIEYSNFLVATVLYNPACGYVEP